MERGKEVIAGNAVLKWTAIATNALLIVWMFGTAYAWTGGDWLGGTVVSIPPALAIIALLRK